MMRIPRIRRPRGGEMVRVEVAYQDPVIMEPRGGEEAFYVYVEPHPGEDEYKLFAYVTEDGKGHFWPVRCPVPQEHFAFRAMGKWLRYPVMH
jgi:hypothetical protein